VDVDGAAVAEWAGDPAGTDPDVRASPVDIDRPEECPGVRRVELAAGSTVEDVGDEVATLLSDRRPLRRPDPETGVADEGGFPAEWCPSIECHGPAL
jgi:hypothetical protein